MEYNGISFSHDRTLATGITAEIVPETDAPPGAFLNSRRPTFTRFTPVGYAPSGYEHRYLAPEISVFSIPEFEGANPYFATVLPDLTNLLAQKPPALGPTVKLRLPLVGDPQAQGRMQVAYSRFRNGSGVRFVTYYRDYHIPLVQEDLRYIFQGISDDGNYYVLAILPVSVSFLPERQGSANLAIPTLAPQDANAQDYVSAVITFNKEAERKIEKLAPGDFKPDLGLLDAMVRSIEIK